MAIYTEAKSLIDSSVSLSVAVGALKTISCFMRFLSWQFQTIDTLDPPFSQGIQHIPRPETHFAQVENQLYVSDFCHH